jgi:hypothetical protein
MVCQLEKAQLDSTQLAIWACLDNLVPSDGDCSLVGLAEGRLDSRSNATVPTAIVAQCRVVRTVLSAKVTGPGLYRNCYVVVRHPGDIDRILEGSSGRRLVALPIFDLGQLLDGAKLFNLAVERLIMSATTIGISH